MNRVFYFCIFLSFLVFACTKSPSDYRVSDSGIVAIRGYEARNDNGEKLADIGNPDIRLTYPSGNPANSVLGISSFPNPARDVIKIVLFSKHPGAMARVWVVPATFGGEGSEATVFMGTTMILSGSRPLLDTTLLLSLPHKYLIIRNLPEGYYRIYLKSEGGLLWDNLVFTKVLQP